MNMLEAKYIWKKLFLYVCIFAIVFSNVSLALPKMQAYAADPTSPSAATAPQLLITEIMPNNTGTDDFEFFEVYNNTNQPMVLDYFTFVYRYTDGSAADKKLQYAPVTVAPKKTMVFWNNVKNQGIDAFNSHYKTTLTDQDIISFSMGTSMANGGNRGIAIIDNQGKDLVTSSYLAADISDGLDLHYQYPATGMEMTKYQKTAAPTPGTVDPTQIPQQEVSLANSPAPVITHTPVAEVVNTEDVKITAQINSGDQPTKTTLYYQNKADAAFEAIPMTTTDGHTYEAMIGKDKYLFNKISYYIKSLTATGRAFYPENTTTPIDITIKEAAKIDYNSYPKLLITELSPNSNGTGTDNYEFIELYNNTNQPLNLANYSFVYVYTDGSNTDKPFQIPSPTIEPQKSLVLWFNNGGKTLADFNTNFGTSLIADQVLEFKDVFPGFANGGNRALVIKDQAGAEVASASYLGTDNDNTGLGIEYKYPLVGTVMDKQKVLAAPTPGKIDAVQVPATPVNIPVTPVDTEAPVIQHTAVTNSPSYSPITIEATITDNITVPTATLYYKTAGANDFKLLSMNASTDGSGKYTAEIPAADVTANITYYIEATDGIQASKTNENTMTVTVDPVDYNKLPIFLVTEVVPDSANIGGADGYEYIEVYNNTNKDLNFKDYKINYRYGSDPASDVVWPSVPDDVIIPSKKTMVFWIINKANTASTVADFNANYGTNLVENKDIVRIYSDGMSNSAMRGLVVATNTKEEISASYYMDTTVDDTQPNKGITFKYPEDGSTKLVKIGAGVDAATPGKVDPIQVPKQVVQLQTDDVAPTIENSTTSTEVKETDNIQISAKVTDNIEVKSVRLYYRMNSGDAYKEVILPKQSLYEYTIPYADIIGKKEVEYYFVASDGTNDTTSNTYKIKVNSQYDKSSLRLDVKDGDILAGVQTLKGTSQADSADQVKMFIDNKEMTNNVEKSLEHPAYFAYEVSGINVFFQNGVTMGNDILHIFDDTMVDWNTIIVPIDEERLQVGDNIITVRAGNKASPFQLDASEENRDDFNLRNVRLVLPDGTVLRDPAKTNPSQVFDMGDDGFYRPFENFTFTLTAAQAPSKKYKWDTTAVADGKHVITIKDTDEELSANVFVDNTAPTIETSMEDGKEYKGAFDIKVNATDALAGVETVKVMLDGKAISQNYPTSSSQLAAGEHTLTMTAIDKVGNKKEQTIHFRVFDENPSPIELFAPADGVTATVNGSPALQVKVADPSNDDLNVSFYQGFKYDTNRLNEVKAFKNASDIEPPQTMVPEGETAFTVEDMSLVSQVDGKYLTNNSNTQFPYHRFEVTVDPAVNENDLVELVWKGKSLEGRKVSMYAWNHQTNKWARIDYKIAGATDFELKGHVQVADFVKDHKINVLVQDEIPKSPSEYDYTFAWMSDTQYYSASYPQIYQRLTDWIVAKQKEMNIKYVFHTGDVVDQYDILSQWQNADKAMKTLEDNNIPYGVLAGNHDVNHKDINYTEYYKWFGEDRVKNQPTFGESYKNNRGHYDLISAGGNDFIMLYMGWGITDEDIQWMNDVLKQYPDRIAILNFHEYLLVSGNRAPLADKLYEEVVKPNKNVVAVLSGHYHDSETLISEIDDNGDGKTDRKVYQMLADYQGAPEGGQGFIRLLHFDQDNNSIIVNSYSPYLDKYNYYDPAQSPGKDEFTINVDLQVKEKQVATDYFAVNIYSNTKIGATQNVKSGSNVEVKWNGLSGNAVYSWYAVAEDAFTGKRVSDIWTFTKGKNTQETKVDKTYNLKNFKTKKLVITTPFSLVDLDETSVIPEGLLVKTSATLKGTGLKNTKVIINPNQKDAVVDLGGVEVKEIQINSNNIKEIRGAENVKKWTVANGVDASAINVVRGDGTSVSLSEILSQVK